MNGANVVSGPGWTPGTAPGTVCAAATSAAVALNASVATDAVPTSAATVRRAGFTYGLMQ